jgi:hypothetical protein
MSEMPERMSRQDRAELKEAAKLKARVAKHRVAQLKADRIADFEELLATEFDPLDERWEDVVTEANRAIHEAIQKVNARIDEQLPDVPKRYRPSVHGGMGFMRRGENWLNERRVELRRVATTRYDEMAKHAIAEIEAKVAAVQIDLIERGLSTAEAREYLASIPEPQELIPTLRIEDVSTDMRRELTQKARTGRGYLERLEAKEALDAVGLGDDLDELDE